MNALSFEHACRTSPLKIINFHVQKTHLNGPQGNLSHQPAARGMAVLVFLPLWSSLKYLNNYWMELNFVQTFMVTRG